MAEGDRPELIAQPLEVFVATVGTAFPDLGAEVPADWSRLGRTFPANIGEDGITVQPTQEVEEFFGQSTMAVEAFRTEEGLVFTIPVADLRLETWRWVLGNDINDETIGEVAIDFERGPNTKKLALLARGLSPYDRSKQAQFEVPVCYHSGEPEVEFSKGDPGELELEFTSLRSEAGKIRLRAEEAAA